MLPFQRHLQTVRLSSLLGQGQKSVGPVSQLFYLSGSCGTYNNPHRCSKRVGDVDPGGVANLSWAKWVICKNKLKLKPLFDVCSAPYGGGDENLTVVLFITRPRLLKRPIALSNG